MLQSDESLLEGKHMEMLDFAGTSRAGNELSVGDYLTIPQHPNPVNPTDQADVSRKM